MRVFLLLLVKWTFIPGYSHICITYDFPYEFAGKVLMFNVLDEVF